MDSSDDDYVQGGALDRCLKRVVRDEDPWSVKRTIRGEMTFKRRGDMNSRITRAADEEETAATLARGFWISLPGATSGTLLERIAGVLGVRQERYRLVSTTYTVSGITSTVNAAANVGDWFDVWTLRPSDGLHINASKQSVTEGDYALPLILPSGITYPQVRTRLRAVQAHSGIGSLLGPAEVSYGSTVSVIPALPYTRYSTPNATDTGHYVFASAGFRLWQAADAVELSGAKLTFLQPGGGAGGEIADDVTGVFGAYCSVEVLTADPYVQLAGEFLYNSGLPALVALNDDNHATNTNPISIPTGNLDMGVYVYTGAPFGAITDIVDNFSNPNLDDALVSSEYQPAGSLNYDTVLPRVLGSNVTVDDSGSNTADDSATYTVATIAGSSVTFSYASSGSYTLHTESSLNNEWWVWCSATAYDPPAYNWSVGGTVNVAYGAAEPMQSFGAGVTYYDGVVSGGGIGDGSNDSTIPWTLNTYQKRYAGNYTRRTFSTQSDIETTMDGHVIYSVQYSFAYDRKTQTGTRFFIDADTGYPVTYAGVQAAAVAYRGGAVGEQYHRAVTFSGPDAGVATYVGVYAGQLASGGMGWTSEYFAHQLTGVADTTTSATGSPVLSVFTRDYIYYDKTEGVYVSFVTEADTVTYSARYEVDFRGTVYTFAYADRSLMPQNYDYVDWIYDTAEEDQHVEANVPYVVDSGGLPIFSPNYCEQGTCPFIAYTTIAEEAAGVQPEFLLDMPMTPTLYTGYVNPGRVQSACIFVPHQAIKAFRKYYGAQRDGVLWNNTNLMRDLFQEQKRLQVSLSSSGAWANALGVSAYSDPLTTINIGRT